MDQDKGNLIKMKERGGGGKASNGKTVTRSLPRADRCLASLQATATLERVSSTFITEHDIYGVWNIPLVSWGHLSWLHTPSLWVGRVGNRDGCDAV